MNNLESKDRGARVVEKHVSLLFFIQTNSDIFVTCKKRSCRNYVLRFRGTIKSVDWETGGDSFRNIYSSFKCKVNLSQKLFVVTLLGLGT